METGIHRLRMQHFIGVSLHHLAALQGKGHGRFAAWLFESKMGHQAIYPCFLKVNSELISLPRSQSQIVVSLPEKSLLFYEAQEKKS